MHFTQTLLRVSAQTSIFTPFNFCVVVYIFIWFHLRGNGHKNGRIPFALLLTNCRITAIKCKKLVENCRKRFMFYICFPSAEIPFWMLDCSECAFFLSHLFACAFEMNAKMCNTVVNGNAKCMFLSVDFIVGWFPAVMMPHFGLLLITAMYQRTFFSWLSNARCCCWTVFLCVCVCVLCSFNYLDSLIILTFAF